MDYSTWLATEFEKNLLLEDVISLRNALNTEIRQLRSMLRKACCLIDDNYTFSSAPRGHGKPKLVLNDKDLAAHQDAIAVRRVCTQQLKVLVPLLRMARVIADQWNLTHTRNNRLPKQVLPLYVLNFGTAPVYWLMISNTWKDLLNHRLNKGIIERKVADKLAANFPKIFGEVKPVSQYLAPERSGTPCCQMFKQQTEQRGLRYARNQDVSVEAHWEIQVHDLSGFNGLPITVASLPIQFCPHCGKKLS